MYTKVLALLALATIVNANDIIVGLKTDGNKFFDENRQANPALWRQMDNVTVKAPENEVIRRVVITDLRPEKDGDVRIVDGGEYQKNVTIELKSPTVLRGYEFHIEVYSTPEENVPSTHDQESTTEIIRDDSGTTVSTTPTMNLDTTSKLPDLTTEKIVPAVFINDDANERQGRNAKNEDNIALNNDKTTTELPSTTFKDVSTSPTTQFTDSATENHSEKSSDATNKIEHISTISPIPLNKNFNPAVPAISAKDIENDNSKVTGNDETRHVRDTDKELSGKSTEATYNIDTTNIRFELTTENDEEATTTELNDEIPVEEKSEDGINKEVTDSKFNQFNNRKYTSIISTKVENPDKPVDMNDEEKLRNARETNEEVDESISTTPDGTTTDINDETTTLATEDHVTTEATSVQNPGSIGKDEGKIDSIPIYINNRQWNQRVNNPTFQTGNQRYPDLKLYPAVLTNDQSTIVPETDAKHLGNDYKPTPDHMENRNPKISAIASPDKVTSSQ